MKQKSLRQLAKEILLYGLQHGIELEQWEIDKIELVNMHPRIRIPELT